MWRRLVRLHELPPVILWWVSGLDRYVIIDGVHRAVAALEEGSLPRCLALVPWEKAERSLVGISAWHNLADAVERSMQRTDPHAIHGAQKCSDSWRARANVDHEREQTGLYNTAWPLPGGSLAWAREVSEEVRASDLAGSRLLTGCDI
jgi:hypothetical protein